MDETAHIDDRLESLISSLDEWLWETDVNGQFTYSSPQVEALLGYSIGEILQLTPIDLLHSSDRKRNSETLAQILKNREPFSKVRRYNMHKNGSPVLLEMSGSPFYDVTGNFAGYRGVDYDVSAKDEGVETTADHAGLLESIEEPLMISDSGGKITYINHSFTELFGYSFDEIVGENVAILYPQEITGDPNLQNSPPEIDDSEHARGVRQRRTKTGDALTVLISARSLLDAQGEVSQFVNSYRDISELEKSQAKLSKSDRNEKLLEQSQAIALVGGWELDIPTQSLYWTAETYRLHDTSPDEFNPTVDAGVSYFLPESRKIIEQALQDAMTEAKGYDLILETLTTKGRKIHVRTTCEVTLKDGRPSKLTGVFQDISAFVEKEQSLSFSLKQNELALAAANLGLWVLDVETNRLEWNDVQLEIYGVSREEFDRDPNPIIYRDRIHEDDREELEQLLESARKGMTIENHIFRIIRKSGEVRFVQGSATPVLDNNGLMTKLIGINKDVTEAEHDKNRIESLVAELSKTLDGTIDLAMNINGLRDPYTAGHEYRVGIISGEIGKIMGLSKQAIQGLQECGKLHDIGKFKVPLDILSKPGKLSAAEFAMVKEHAQAGYDVLKDITFPWPIAETALQHHERIDGSGYPQGLKGDEILLEARILGVADVVEAMATHRPYRAQLGIEKALQEIERGSGVIYDAKVADACLKLFREDGFEIPPAPL